MFRKLKRRKEQKTDYNQRLALLKSGKPRLVVRKSLAGLKAQIIEYVESGDKVLLSVSMKDLGKYGWLGGNNISSSYLTGLLTGFEAKKKGIEEAVLDTGLQISSKGNRMYAFAKGCVDAGLKVPLGKEIVPSSERISGKHVEALAAKMKELGRYDKYFSSYIKKGLKPEEMEKHFNQVSEKIKSSFK